MPDSASKLRVSVAVQPQRRLALRRAEGAKRQLARRMCRPSARVRQQACCAQSLRAACLARKPRAIASDLRSWSTRLWRAGKTCGRQEELARASAAAQKIAGALGRQTLPLRAREQTCPEQASQLLTNTGLSLRKQRCLPCSALFVTHAGARVAHSSEAACEFALDLRFGMSN